MSSADVRFLGVAFCRRCTSRYASLENAIILVPVTDRPSLLCSSAYGVFVQRCQEGRERDEQLELGLPLSDQGSSGVAHI